MNLRVRLKLLQRVLNPLIPYFPMQAPALKRQPSTYDRFPQEVLENRLKKIERAHFISDLHLGSQIGPHHYAFRDFLARLSQQDSPGALFIIGDLFDYWIGLRAEEEPGHRFALLCIKRAQQEGLDIYFQEGNRDFLIQEELGERYGFTVLPPQNDFKLGSFNVRLSHGDELITEDRGHQRLRWLIRSGVARGLAESLPTTFIEKIARFLRRSSKGNPAESSSSRRPYIPFSISCEQIARIARGGAEVVICGHVHHESQKVLRIEEKSCQLFTLGAWESSASVLEFDGERFQFKSFPIQSN